MKQPNSKAHLDAAIQRLAGTRTHGALFSELRATIANVAIGQMLPDCVVKGGSALKLRYGERQTRFTMDLDAASRLDADSFVEEMRRRLAEGWCDFTGTLDIERQARPKGVPTEYVMRPFLVHLHYHGKSWCSIRLELSHNEIGDAEAAEEAPLAPDIIQLFADLGFPKPSAIPLMPLKFQIAQKLHGASEPGSTRVRDFIDLQLIMRNSETDLAVINTVCRRLFSYRKRQTWPPVIAKGVGWDEQYSAQRYDLPVLPTVDEAIAWTNDLIRQIDTARV
ncbi:MAG: nucleotidyl transferase AbiEii/AbiGii toxin family protein [Kiritimatiellae bacterium]|nr:nucleotidyl transferase AbiEii/AbiGii toxin family protein [Kiritimatiellia bacterium]